MRLKTIKLAGFKSFVDVTTVPFPEEMTAIVGPNGCGKSNIIDAVRWVLGESSAKNLRGDSMTDVIFNGSSARKPVGQASVELLFDNTDQRIQGSMADRNEISIRRIVNRDSQNTYYLNGSKCRRKDITDIFLGTGLGPRSYAIIEQGMISKLIESKPQDLRVFIEEAAGVSKYKERRRETEIRIRHTRENLSRLADIRQELGIQIERLHGQSQAAVRFKQLKVKERTLKAELTAIKWRYCQDKLQKFKLLELSLERKIDELVAEQRASELAIVNAKNTQDEGADKIAVLQQHKLVLTTEITRLEQNIKHAKQRKISLSEDVKRLDENSLRNREYLNQELKKQQNLKSLIVDLVPCLKESGTQIKQLSKQLLDIQHRQHAWQTHWDNFVQTQSSHTNAVNVIATKVQSTSDLMNKTEQRIESIKQQLTSYQLEPLKSKIVQNQDDIEEQKMVVEQSSADVEQYTEQYLIAITAQDKSKTLFEQISTELQTLQSRQQALSEINNQRSDWQIKQKDYLQSMGIDTQNSLSEQLLVTPGWESAVEMVLGQWLNAICLDDFPDHFDLDVALWVSQTENQKLSSAKPNTLAQFVQGQHPFYELLSRVKVAQTETQAKHMAEQLTDDNASVICPQGAWFGRSWLKKGAIEQHTGQLKRHNQLIDLAANIKNKQTEFEIHQQALGELQEKNIRLNASLEQNKQQLQQSKQVLLQSEQENHLLDQELQFKRTQQQSLQDELLKQETALNEELYTYEQVLAEQAALAQSDQNDNQVGETLQLERTTLVQQLQDAQLNLQHATNENHQQNLAKEKAKTELESVEAVLVRVQEQLLTLEQQKQQLVSTVQENDQPIIAEQEKLQSLLLQGAENDQQQQTVNKQLIESNNQIEQFNSSQQRLLTLIAVQRDKLSQLHVDAQTYNVRAKTAIEQLEEMQQTLAAVLDNLTTDAKESQWQIQLARVTKEISQLGAINLAAIEEFELQSQRKEFLDKQNDDLESALHTLESAIDKIDKETRQKFKETFEQVNNDLKILFPKVFGGGSAYLDLTGEDLLDTGVTIMARPPGKKNSTIHLLSGGEKALTALSLVFAIFRLNPAPFCMLDEVDAPLDDANVGRFCKLVEEMSQTVQFIYISHNKIAMEMASHLTGVTMHEPGVSRMVAVDIDEAVAMAEAV
ncbi:chromosome segregation protein SMC [Thalassotalea psychrophila]|uniref:Chromosome partition protein Smc n=1 Tax=Thalassotalea psychrophila TaxID=3065647 RepID=A0ABY9TT71_9GAMM|nr:chromosome segregation protein SMC [Colwelliaceae bacterium SQ149]